jgi:prolyl oligopeptidase
MPALMEPPPFSPVEPVTEVLHGVPVTDPYRWLEDQGSPRTREWIAAQTRYARSYLDYISGRERIRDRIRELLDVETYDSLHKVGSRYFFRKRCVGQEQFCICMREGFEGTDEVLIDPALRGTGPHTAVRPLRVSPDGQLLLYEVKQGGEHSSTFELLNIKTRETLPDTLPRGFLRGFAFAPDSLAFYYVHDPQGPCKPHLPTAYKHVLGTSFAMDDEVFVAGEGPQVELHIIPGLTQLGFLVLQFEKVVVTDFYAYPLEGKSAPRPVIRNAQFTFVPLLLNDGRILAAIDREAPNMKIVEVRLRDGEEPECLDIVSSSAFPIQNWTVIGDRIFVSYLRKLQTEIDIFSLSGGLLGRVPIKKWDTVRLLGGSEDGDEMFFERESFTKPVQINSYVPSKSAVMLWAKRNVPFDSHDVAHIQVCFPTKDGTQIPMFLVGRQEVLEGKSRPAIMTSYGGYGVPMTPQFSVFVSFLIDRGCLFAVPNIRGGSEFGAAWHEAARRQNRQIAFDDFIAAAEWLVNTGRTDPHRLAIFGGSNSGLLVAAAMTQRPDLFRAVVCIAPVLDMVRYHLFDNAGSWKDEFGSADDPKDLDALLRYSPYHNLRANTPYPATMFISGDCDQKCNPLHARKMTARMQAANISDSPVFLDYSRHRGHAPVLPLSERIDALTDRMAFLCDQLQLTV